jgi:uncharacterized caspase-like protein
MGARWAGGVWPPCPTSFAHPWECAWTANPDGEGANSPFSAALSRHIGTPGLDVQQMLTRVRAEVVAVTQKKQVPWSNSSLLGEVYLAQ